MKKMLLSTAAAVAIFAAPAGAMAENRSNGEQTPASDKLDRAQTADNSGAERQTAEADRGATGGERLGKPGEMAKSDAEKADDARADAQKSESAKTDSGKTDDMAKAEGQSDASRDRDKSASEDRARSKEYARGEDKSVIGDRARDTSERSKTSVRADVSVKARGDRSVSGRDRARLSYSERSRSVDVDSRERARSYARASYRGGDRLDVDVRARDGYSGRGYGRHGSQYTAEYGRSRGARLTERETVGVEGGVRRSGATTAEQRSTVRQRFAGADRSHRVARSTLGSTRVVEGAEVPRTVAVERVPAQVVETAPEYRDYGYFTTDDDRVVVVNPKTYRVVTVVEED